MTTRTVKHVTRDQVSAARALILQFDERAVVQGATPARAVNHSPHLHHKQFMWWSRARAGGVTVSGLRRLPQKSV